jgi:hypothetical protein
MKKLILFAAALMAASVSVSCEEKPEDSASIVGAWSYVYVMPVLGGEPGAEKEILTPAFQFNEDGTGSVNPDYRSNFASEMVPMTWSLSGSTLHIELEEGEAGDFTVSELTWLQLIMTGGAPLYEETAADRFKR